MNISFLKNDSTSIAYLRTAAEKYGWSVKLFGKNEALCPANFSRAIKPNTRISIRNSKDVIIFRGAFKNCCFGGDYEAFNLFETTPKISRNSIFHMRIEDDGLVFPYLASDEFVNTFAPLYSKDLTKFLINCINANVNIEESMQCKTERISYAGKDLLFFTTPSCSDIIDLESEKPVDINSDLFVEVLETLHFISVL